jgi:hypothetical protein
MALRFTFFFTLCFFMAGQTLATSLLRYPIADPREGTFVVKIYGFTNQNAASIKFKSIVLVETVTNKKHELKDLAHLGAGYSVFASSLPVGKYMFYDLDKNNWSVGANGPVSAGEAPKSPLSKLFSSSEPSIFSVGLGSFSIEASAMTNFGVAVIRTGGARTFKPEITVLNTPEIQKVVLEDFDQESLRTVQSFSQRSGDSASTPDKVVTALTRFRTDLGVVSYFDKSLNDKIIIGGTFGAVHLIGSDGARTTVSTGSLDNITHAKILPDGNLFAGTSAGRYFFGPLESSTWKAYQLPVLGRIVQIESMGESGVAIMTQTDGNPELGMREFKLFHVPNLAEVEKATELIKFDGASAGIRMPMHFNGEKLIVHFNRPGLSRKADLIQIDPRTKQVTSQRLDHWVLKMFAGESGQLLRERMNGLLRYSDVSTDGGRNWNLAETGTSWNGVHFQSKDVAYSAKVGVNFANEPFVEVARTTDSAVTWEKAAKTVEGYGGEIDIKVTAQSVYVFNGRDISTSADFGNSWKKIWPAK